MEGKPCEVDGFLIKAWNEIDTTGKGIPEIYVDSFFKYI